MHRHTLALLVTLTPVAAFAQVARDTARIAPVVVTATRSPLSAERAPASVTVISGDQLRREGITTVLDALRQVPGVSAVQTGSYGGATSVFIRGGESKFTKVLIDGVPVNDAGGAFDFSSLSTDNIERIEIVRGPASVLYGSDAMAGVIQLFTRRGDGRPRVELSGRGGGFGSYDTDAAVRGSTEALSYSFAGARHATDGIQLFNSQYRQTVGSGLVGFHGQRADFRASIRYSDNNVHFPTDGAGQVVDSNAMHREDRIAVGVDAGVRIASGVDLRLSLASHDVHGVSSDKADSPGDVDGYYFSTGDRTRRRSGDLRLDVELPSAMRLSVGAQVEREWQASGTESNYGPSAFTARRRTVGGYAQLLYAPIAPYTVTLGLRHENNEQFGTFFTYRAAGSARIASSTRLRASVGTAFREPTFLENFGGAFAIGNPALTPEHAFSFDAGIEQAIGRTVTLGITGFSNSFRDLIDYKYSATQPNYFNIARTRSAGAEVEARIDLPNGLRADASLTYLATRVVDPGTSLASTALFAPGARLLRRPMHTLDAGVGYHRGLASVDLRAHRVGPREDNYFAPDFTTKHVTLRSYVRTDLSAEVPVLEDHQRRVTLTARAENLFDTRYTDVAGWNHDFALSDDASVARTGYRGAGRRLMTGLRVAF
jgi:vitamin B12 transporter